MNLEAYKIKLLGVFILATLSASAQTIQEKRIATEIQSVVVYLDGADITHTTVIDIPAGKSKIVFTGLSPQLNPKSIRVKLPSQVDVLSVNSQLDYLFSKELSPQIKSLSDSLNLINEQITALNDEKSAYNTEYEMLLQNKDLGSPAGGVSIVNLSNAADFFRVRVKDINSKISHLNLAITKQEITKERLTQQLNILNHKSTYKRGEVTILVSSKEKVTAEAELKYIVQQAGWVPTYDIKAQEVNQPITLNYKAKVYNDTEIDWKNVSLTLSTANPSMNASKPNLETWYLNYHHRGSYQNQTTHNWEGELNDQTLADSIIGKYVSANKKRKDAEDQKPKGKLMEVSDLSVEFAIQEKYSISADANPYFVQIKSYDLPATYKHFAAPKKDKNAFLIARITDWEDLNLVSGVANIYLDNTYVGWSFINTTGTNDTLDISLGRDSKVIITRIKQKEYSKKVSMGASRKDILSYEIEVKNNRNAPINIEIVDQLPISQDSDIEVGKLEITNANHNALTGELKWEFSLEPSTIKKMQLSFYIKYPKNKPVQQNTTQHMNVRFL
jgi:uncharacterized protein (TIGR02231 family)